MTSGIYKLVNKRTSETYVGQSKNVQKRAERHIQELKESIHHNAGMQEDFNNGDEFVLELVEETNPHKQILNEHEMLWISRLNTFLRRLQ